MPLSIHPLVVTLFSLVVLIPLGLVMSVFEPWQALTGHALLYCAGSAVTLSVAYVLIVQAMRFGEVSVVAPFRYTFLLWAIVVQVVVFSVWPDRLTLLGSAILVATGLYTVYRERKVKGRDAATLTDRAGDRPTAAVGFTMPSAPRPPMTPALRGIAAMIASQFAFITNDTLIKLTSDTLPFGEIVFLRGVIASLLIGALALWSGLGRELALARPAGPSGSASSESSAEPSSTSSRSSRCRSPTSPSSSRRRRSPRLPAPRCSSARRSAGAAGPPSSSASSACSWSCGPASPASMRTASTCLSPCSSSPCAIYPPAPCPRPCRPSSSRSPRLSPSPRWAARSA